VHDHANGQAQKFVNLAHPLGVALGQIIVHRDHVNAVPGKGIQIARQRGDQRLAFAGLHFRDLALVQHHAADELHVEVPHIQLPATGFADYGKRLGKKLVQDFLFSGDAFVGVFNAFKRRGNPLAELDRLRPQLFVRELLHFGLKRIDRADTRNEALDHALVAGPEYLR
jgi:hypothetical protein